jgi:uncharacterized membrane protein YgcG
MQAIQERRQDEASRRGGVLVLAAALLVVIFAFAAFAVDASYMSLVSTELQNAADAAALGGIMRLASGQDAVIQEAQDTAKANVAGGSAVSVAAEDIVFGTFDVSSRVFTPGALNPNAVRVTAKVQNQSLFFAPILGQSQFSMSRSAVAMVSPRDIVFCVDLSGSMNDDTEPCWATTAINNKLASQGETPIGNALVQQVYNDFGFGSAPGAYQYIGSPLGIGVTDLAYAIMTQDNGPLTLPVVPLQYRINNSDSEAVRKTKAYSWIIDHQLAVLMPKAKPFPDSGNAASLLYWTKYLDYVIKPRSVGSNPPSSGSSGSGSSGSGSGSSGSGSSGSGSGSSTPPPPSPPSGSLDDLRFWNLVQGGANDFPRDLGQLADASSWSAAQMLATSAVGVTWNGLPRNGSTLLVTLPPSQDGDRITGFNNPNKSTFPTASSSLAANWRNYVGYVTYVQFMMDWGRDRSPDVGNSTNASPTVGIKTQLSVLSPNCPYHTETVNGESFLFPPSEQPTHALRRSLIRAIQEIAAKNEGLGPGVGDRVAIVTFDAVDAYHAPQIVLPLTDDYAAAKAACCKLQAVSDIGNSTATENGMILARNHLKPTTEGGQGRTYSTKVLVLLTDGVPNVWQSSATEIGNYMSANPHADYYDPLYPWYNSVLMQTDKMRAGYGKVFPVGMGLGCDYDFMDRIARMADTADKNGQSMHGSSNPSQYEERMVEIFKNIINTRGGKLVQ